MIHFNNHQVITERYNDPDSELLTPTQRLLLKQVNSFNNLCSDLQEGFNGYSDNAVQKIRDDVYEVRNSIEEIKQYLDYIAKASTKLVTMYEKQNMYSYYNVPVKDEFGTVIDGEFYTQAPTPPPMDSDLLRIDRSGQIWIDGQVETNTVKIGDAIKRLAEDYKNYIPINTIDDLGI